MSKRKNHKKNNNSVNNSMKTNSVKTNGSSNKTGDIVPINKNKTELKIYIDNISVRNERFESLCLLSQEDLKQKMFEELSDDKHELVCRDGFLYRNGTIPVLLVAHLDTVHKDLPNEIVYANGTISSKQGIGGDDRCGVYMITEILKQHDCHVLFTEDEEIGCIGTEKFLKDPLSDQLINKFQYLVELDRKGSTDAVFYECDNDKFEDFITKKYWKTNYGSFTDIVELSPVLKAASVNCSCGYYKAHTTEEYVVLDEMENNIKEVCALLERTTAEDSYEYIESKYSRKYSYGGYYGGYYGYGSYDYYDGYGMNSYKRPFSIYHSSSNGYFRVEKVLAVSEDEAVGKFLKKNPNLCYKNITDIKDSDNFTSANNHKAKFKCECCDKMVPFDEIEIVDEMAVCSECLDKYFTMCDYCGEYALLEECHQLKDNSIICSDCYEDYGYVYEDYNYGDVNNNNKE